MDKSRVIYLIADNREKDENGVYQKTESEPRKVFAQVESVTRSEFFEGGRNGLNPELRFIVFFADYHGEEIVQYNGDKYGVYRTFIDKGDYIELYTERKGGVN